MIREVESMLLRGYFYTCLDRLTEKCRSFEEDLPQINADNDSNTGRILFLLLYYYLPIRLVNLLHV